VSQFIAPTTTVVTMVESVATMVRLDFLLCLGPTVGFIEENVPGAREGE